MREQETMSLQDECTVVLSEKIGIKLRDEFPGKIEVGRNPSHRGSYTGALGKNLISLSILKSY